MHKATNPHYLRELLGDFEMPARLLLDSTVSISALLDREGVLHHVSPAFATLLGHAQVALIGRNLRTLLPPGDVGWVEHKFTEAVHTGTAVPLELRLRGVGAWRYLQGEIRAMNGYGFQGFLINAYDVTASRSAEGALDRLNRLLRTLAACNHVMIHAQDEWQLLDKICKAIVNKGRYRMAWVGYAEQGPGQPLRPVAHAGHEKGYLKGLPLTWADSYTGQSLAAARAVHTRRTVILTGVQDGSVFIPWREQAQARGYASVIALPLLERQQPFGALSIYASEKDAFDRQTVRLLEELAGNLAHGIMRLRMEAARRQTEQSLRESKAWLERIEHVARTGGWEWNMDTGEVVWSAETYRLFGLDPQKFTPSLDGFLDRVPAADRERVREALDKRTEYRLEHELLLPDGTTRSVESVGEVFRDAVGRPVRMLGTVRDITECKGLERERMEHAERLQRAMLQTVEAVATTVEKRDPYTAGHQRRVAALAVAIARELSLPSDQIAGLRLGALIHDIGKIALPTEILNRPGTLTWMERELIKSHPQVGYEIVKDAEFRWPIAQMVLQHHERMDGQGYPQGLQGEAICQEARILAVADVVESIASHRPYRPMLGIDFALQEIASHRGTRYDPVVVDACLGLFRDKNYVLEMA